jgi:hypothetical protein
LLFRTRWYEVGRALRRPAQGRRSVYAGKLDHGFDKDSANPDYQRDHDEIASHDSAVTSDSGGGGASAFAFAAMPQQRRRI